MDRAILRNFTVRCHCMQCWNGDNVAKILTIHYKNTLYWMLRAILRYIFQLSWKVYLTKAFGNSYYF